MKYVLIVTTKKTDEKANHMGGFILIMGLNLFGSHGGIYDGLHTGGRNSPFNDIGRRKKKDQIFSMLFVL